MNCLLYEQPNEPKTVSRQLDSVAQIEKQYLEPIDT